MRSLHPAVHRDTNPEGARLYIACVDRGNVDVDRIVGSNRVVRVCPRDLGDHDGIRPCARHIGKEVGGQKRPRFQGFQDQPPLNVGKASANEGDSSFHLTSASPSAGFRDSCECLLDDGTSNSRRPILRQSLLASVGFGTCYLAQRGVNEFVGRAWEGHARVQAAKLQSLRT